MRPKRWMPTLAPLLAASLLCAACSDSSSQRPDAAEKWRRAQLVFPALSIDASTNEWTSPEHLDDQFGFICWPDIWPAIPQWLSLEELAATAVVACPPLNDERVAIAMARITSFDKDSAARLLLRARDALRN